MFKSGIFLAIITMLSRIMGLVRNTVSAKYFGASYQNDAFNSSFRIANLFRQLLGEGALGNTFIPIYNKKEKELGKEEARKLIFSVLNLLCLFLIILTIITIIFSNQQLAIWLSLILIIFKWVLYEEPSLFQYLKEVMSFVRIKIITIYNFLQEHCIFNYIDIKDLRITFWF